MNEHIKDLLVSSSVAESKGLSNLAQSIHDSAHALNDRLKKLEKVIAKHRLKKLIEE